MERRDSIEDRHFRDEVKTWLHEHKPRSPRPGESSFADQMAYDRAWQRAQYDGGWAGISWPKQYGGRGLSPVQQLIWCEEYASAHSPAVMDSCWLALNHAGPTLIARGSDAQKAFHLPRILKGEATWCQGFSEPNAGSDLASLRTRAVVDGDHLVVNGQKIWTTYAHLADCQELLVRTGPPDSRHRGITWAICDMHAPGVDVRPIKALDGKHHNCEVFYDNVRIPLSNVVGDINDGWSVALTTLGLERGSAGFSAICEVAVAFEELVARARTEPRSGTNRTALEDGDLADRLGALRARLQSIRALMYMMVSAAERDIDLGAEGALMHLNFSELCQAIGRVSLEMLAPQSLSRTQAGSWLEFYFNAFSATIAGGTSEIHRNIIGERLLGLPR
jgi:alkylation response protein AidB-like acyl-CoA dehydrogenase